MYVLKALFCNSFSFSSCFLLGVDNLTKFANETTEVSLLSLKRCCTEDCTPTRANMSNLSFEKYFDKDQIVVPTLSFNLLYLFSIRKVPDKWTKCIAVSIFFPLTLVLESFLLLKRREIGCSLQYSVQLFIQILTFSTVSGFQLLTIIHLGHSIQNTLVLRISGKHLGSECLILLNLQL